MGVGIGMKKTRHLKMKISFTTLWFAVVALVSAPLHAVEDHGSTPVDFAREIIPLLSDKCFVCHGPDGEEKDVLRLDSFAGGHQAKIGRASCRERV